MSTLLIIGLLVAAALVGTGLGYYLRFLISLGQRGSAELQIRKMMLDAEVKAKHLVSGAEEEALKKRDEMLVELKERERDLRTTEDRLVSKEDLLDKRQFKLDSEQETIMKKADELAAAKERVEELAKEQQARLEKVAGLSAEDAKKQLMDAVEKQAESDLENRMRKLEISGN